MTRNMDTLLSASLIDYDNHCPTSLHPKHLCSSTRLVEPPYWLLAVTSVCLCLSYNMHGYQKSGITAIVIIFWRSSNDFFNKLMLVMLVFFVDSLSALFCHSCDLFPASSSNCNKFHLPPHRKSCDLYSKNIFLQKYYLWFVARRCCKNI